VVATFKDDRIKLISQPNGGVSAALNCGLKHATGKYILRFDADDVCYPNRFQIQYDFITANPDYVLVGSDADYMTEDGEFIFYYKNVGHANDEINKTILTECSFIHSSVIYPKEVVMQLGGYEVKAHTFEDFYLWKKLIKKGKVCNIPQALMKVRFNSSSVTIDEKDHNPDFLRLKRKALNCGEITDEEGILLKTCITKLSPKHKEASYNRMLAKKFLWDNYQPKKARQYIRKTLILEPINLTSYLLLFVSVLPKSLIVWLYHQKKAKV
ncbi:MAG: glycosyltransferase, partial [Bacteroidia bacterium]|nr:glycosyltransferase [Bacteroidia bacterium]